MKFKISIQNKEGTKVFHDQVEKLHYQTNGNFLVLDLNPFAGDLMLEDIDSDDKFRDLIALSDKDKIIIEVVGNKENMEQTE